ncbi:arsenite efflux transporter metallochaperone ArsD [Nocardia sp. 2]|uniref:Arsenite efflux transporter metallochaperone ArsD n=1 Tax=Nocardia acididurans TaxID=2802282 RepID=A0ABS1M6T9_9NOCA|nr:arsenite efflux transporter metallochaperone ArsD [Nocardia acididurans]MBL1076367.1 arsenite efflux transporter metallochaperone ArsD [Nocardia acididurans]
MSTVEIFEPALCCNTGVCGPDLDQSLVEFSADLDWVSGAGGAVTRHNLAGDPMAFATNDAVRQFLELAGSDGLPLVLVNGVTVLTGRYPTRAQLARWAGVEEPAPVTPPSGARLLDLSASAACEPESGCC